eukprot:gene4396-5569_t
MHESMHQQEIWVWSIRSGEASAYCNEALDKLNAARADLEEREDEIELKFEILFKEKFDSLKDDFNAKLAILNEKADKRSRKLNLNIAILNSDVALNKAAITTLESTLVEYKSTIAEHESAIAQLESNASLRDSTVATLRVAL